MPRVGLRLPRLRSSLPRGLWPSGLGGGGLMAVVSRGVQVVVAETATRLSSHFRSGGHGQTLSRTVARVADARRPSGGVSSGCFPVLWPGRSPSLCGRHLQAGHVAGRGLASSRFPLSLAYRGLSDAVWGAAPARASRPQWPLGRTAGSPTGRGAGDPQSGQSCPQSQSLCPPPPVLTAPGTVGTPPRPILGYAEFPTCVPCGLLALSSKAACWALPATGCEA